MPYKDPEKKKAADRERMRQRRANPTPEYREYMRQSYRDYYADHRDELNRVRNARQSYRDYYAAKKQDTRCPVRYCAGRKIHRVSCWA